MFRAQRSGGVVTSKARFPAPGAPEGGVRVEMETYTESPAMTDKTLAYDGNLAKQSESVFEQEEGQEVRDDFKRPPY